MKLKPSGAAVTHALRAQKLIMDFEIRLCA